MKKKKKKKNKITNEILNIKYINSLLIILTFFESYIIISKKVQL